MRRDRTGTSPNPRWTSGLALLMGAAALWGCDGSGAASAVPYGQEEVRTTSQRLSYGDHTYVISATPKAWPDAVKACADLDMGLLTLDNVEEEQWVATQAATVSSELWTGFNDRGREGTWTWSEAPSSYVHWTPGEPNGGTNESCAVLLTATGTWNDLPCTAPRPFICESAPPTPAQFNGHPYLFYTLKKPWAQARTTCLNQGYDLVSINDGAEDTWLKSQVPAGQASWIGFNDQFREGTWRWSDGMAPTYLNWRRNEPNNTGGYEHCAVNNVPPVGTIPGGGWNDIHCGEYTTFVCERSNPPEGYEHFVYEATGTASATQATADFEFLLEAGQTLEIGTCGIPTASSTGDTFLRMLGPDGLEVTANDDDCKSGGSRIRYRVPACGTGAYVLKAGCFENGTCSGRLVFRVLPPPQPQP
ncbi:C-type lectin domain-containing protein [Pyxidicoccus xibeiensis]|uniref:C-type lectin domain-containing protein n=1 Tax=Pyxidicoccus xibeiensis TaxID=2906759 RepID=UPI0020A6EAB7|nr:C-type lectin domain-containing protein [Pyxidicoccus xibeiensis]MCP3137756.1 hypothetical protein [Pyxidicoccus xibeiensis]